MDPAKGSVFWGLGLCSCRGTVKERNGKDERFCLELSAPWRVFEWCSLRFISFLQGYPYLPGLHDKRVYMRYADPKCCMCVFSGPIRNVNRVGGVYFRAAI